MTPHIKLQKKLEEKLPKGGPSGCYGMYIQITNKLGVKVVGCGYKNRNVSLEEMKTTALEARTAKKVRKVYKNTPKCYGVRVFRIEDRWYTCILYQHLGKVRMHDLDDVDISITTEAIKDKLKQKHIHHDDLHSKNIMFFKGKFWVIDMGQVWFTK